MTIELPLLQMLIFEDDLGDLVVMENAFADHSIASTLHHVGDGRGVGLPAPAGPLR